jgi:hypothetical protein
MDSYLRGDAESPKPIWELVVDGRAVIFGTELREAAYQVVKRTWPASLALLELSRVAVELRSDLGLILPMVLSGSHRRRVEFTMNFQDAQEKAFLDRFAAYDGPKNTADLNATSSLVVPDLRPQGFDLPAVT